MKLKTLALIAVVLIGSAAPARAEGYNSNPGWLEQPCLADTSDSALIAWNWNNLVAGFSAWYRSLLWTL